MGIQNFNWVFTFVFKHAWLSLWMTQLHSRPITIQYRQLWYHSFKTFAINPVILISQCNEIMKTIILCSSPRWFFLTLINGTYLVSCLEWKSGKTLISNKMRKIPYLRVFPHSGVPVIVCISIMIFNQNSWRLIEIEDQYFHFH